MTFRFPCPHCRKPLKADESDRGRRAQCSGCRQIVRIPKRAERRSTAPFSVAADAPHDLRTAAEADDELDMTPMIDVVFQLLIFFMVTVTFALQQALPVPTPDETQALSQQRPLDVPPERDDLLVVRVDADDAVWVEDVLAVSRQDLIAKLRAARTSRGPGGEPGPRRLLVAADPDAHHEAVVLALDAGSSAGMEEVRLTTDEPTE